MIESAEKTSEEESDGRIVFLLDQAKNFCREMGVDENLIFEAYNEESDWAFILKIDALLETATKEIITRSLKLQIKGNNVGKEKLEEFVMRLPVRGRTSLLMLLRATGCPNELCDYIYSVRELRNAFAHDIKQTNKRAFDVIKQQSNFRSLLKKLTPIEESNEVEWINVFEKEKKMFRYIILEEALRFLTMAYLVVVK